jgi:formylglycine-generating enzyme required for sulfatase activity
MMRTIALLLIACAASCAQQPVKCPGPLSERQLTDLLKGQVPEKRLHVIIRTCGVAFVLSGSVRSRLRAAGASADLLEEIRGYGPKNATEEPVAPKARARPQFQQQQETAAGTRKVNPKDGLTYVWIPPGTFTMGCSPGDGECDPDEKPAHRVTITKGFWIGQTEVTQEAYQQAVGTNPSHFQGTKLPVENISWNEAQRYCEAAGMRLPTEAEWEYAARAGSTGARYGNLDAIAWYAGNSGNTTHEAGQKQPNAWGLYDMLGNVWEWVVDWYADYAAGSQSDPRGPASGTYRVLRGGSWDYSPGNARASYCVRFGPEYRFNYIGVRCAVERIP